MAIKVGDKVTLVADSQYKYQQGTKKYGEVKAVDGNWASVNWADGMGNYDYPLKDLRLKEKKDIKPDMEFVRTKNITVGNLERELTVVVVVIDKKVRAGYSVKLPEDKAKEGLSRHIATGRAMSDRTNLVDMEMGKGMDKKYILEAIANELISNVERGTLIIKGIRGKKTQAAAEA